MEFAGRSDGWVAFHLRGLKIIGGAEQEKGRDMDLGVKLFREGPLWGLSKAVDSLVSRRL